ncbi:MAG: ATP-dependent Clp protease ATP-binding subunit [Prevotella sp.]|nr:ATP-dependent Clp protease ATP-binding subunit [Prevotella sp.]
MTNQFSQNISEILAFSREEAARLYCPSIGPEHLLLGMMRKKENPIHQLFAEMDISPKSVKEELEGRLSPSPAISRDGASIQLNEQASNILKLAVLEARMQHTQLVEAEHLLLAMLHDQTMNKAKEILEEKGMTYENTEKLLVRHTNTTVDGIGLPDEDEEEFDTPQAKDSGTQTATSRKPQTKSKTPVLDNFSADLTQAARDGKLDPVVGREREMQRVVEVLCRRKKNNPILIGEPGVGKSAIVEGLAQMITKRHTSPVLFNKRLVSLDMTSIVAGTKYRGQFEERIKALLKELEENPDIIVFIDEIHTMIGAGDAAGSMDAANIMKPALARGTIQCIGATTLDEYRNSIEKDGALERRFQKIIVEPTTAEQTLVILHNIKDRYERHHHVSYTEEALNACVRLTDRYVSDRFFPDKAIDALDEVGSRVHLQHAEIPPVIIDKEKEIEDIKAKKNQAVKAQDYELAASCRDRQASLEGELKKLQQQWTDGDSQQRQTVTEEEVADVVSMMTGVPVQRMAEAEGIRLKGMAAELKKAVIAQDPAIEKMVKAIQRNRVGLREPNHPIGVFMFLGPTGVGKTYLAKKLAEFMFGSADSLIRIDMSEYTEAFNTSRLIGAPPGYVGYEEGGQLTERVRRKPYSIVLLDEIEKAHPNVFNMLLQVLDEGRLTDGNGRLVDFRNTVIIMTSNAGTRQLKEFSHGVGFTAGTLGHNMDDHDRQYARSIIEKSLSRQFAPEFLNRLDEIITFDQLNLEAIRQIVDIELQALFKRFQDLGHSIEVSDEAKTLLAQKGYDVQFGARPLKRALQTLVEDPLCEMLLEGNLDPDTTISIGKKADAEELTFQSSRKEN